jgi:hypothetical protein
MGKYAGAEWVEANLGFSRKNIKLSQLGRDVADLLGELFYGIYHINDAALWRVEWDNNNHIMFSLGWRNLSTVDFDDLTRLVFLAHHMAIRVSVEGSKSHYIRLVFSKRSRSGNGIQRHPTLDESVARFKSSVSFPEYQDTTKGE